MIEVRRKTVPTDKGVESVVEILSGEGLKVVYVLNMLKIDLNSRTLV